MLIPLLAQEAPPAWFLLLMCLQFVIVPVAVLVGTLFTLVAVWRAVFPNYRKPPPSDIAVVEHVEDKPLFKEKPRYRSQKTPP
ncbi:MAG: hypothetical protein ACI814_004661 [Mariniblastus sp.]|jgi:hypothetical protein